MCFPDALHWEPFGTALDYYTIVLTKENGDQYFAHCHRVKIEGFDTTTPYSYCLISSHRCTAFFKEVSLFLFFFFGVGLSFFCVSFHIFCFFVLFFIVLCEIVKSDQFETGFFLYIRIRLFKQLSQHSKMNAKLRYFYNHKITINTC